MILWAVGVAFATIAAGIGVGMACAKFRERHIRLMLGLPGSASGEFGETQAKLAFQALVDTQMKIHAAAPRLTRQQGRKLALALLRARGLVPRTVPADR